MGFDPGLANLGVYCTCGWHVTTTTKPSSGDLASRIVQILARPLEHILVVHGGKDKFDRIFLEGTYGALVDVIKYVLGATLYLAAGIPCEIIHPMNWRRGLFGKLKKGQYDKSAMEKAKPILGVKITQHEADAYCLTRWALYKGTK